jgi:hypothetical protein
MVFLPMPSSPCSKVIKDQKLLGIWSKIRRDIEEMEWGIINCPSQNNLQISFSKILRKKLALGVHG